MADTAPGSGRTDAITPHPDMKHCNQVLLLIEEIYQV